MSLIQIILLVGVLLIFISYFLWLRSAALDIFLISVFVLIGVIFILFPEITNKLASAVGVGRGTDLLFYLSVIGFSFIILLMYSKIRKLEKRITEIIRNQALKEALEKNKIQSEV